MTLSPRATTAATITVEGDCTLVDAITAANTDAPAGSCPAGSGTDQILLTADVFLTEVVSSGEFGDNGTPIITSEIAIVGMALPSSALPARRSSGSSRSIRRGA